MGAMRMIGLTVVLLGTLLAPAASGQVPAGPVVSQVATAQSTEGPRRYWVKDTHHYTSPWFEGARRKMINFGCTRAPYYDPSPRCTDDRGFHHGLDVAMPCGTKLFAGVRGWVVRPASQGALGSAYGPHAFRLRNHDKGVDVVVGHVKRVYVAPGDRVRRGQLIARANKLGAPDGCHLHFEVRPLKGGYTSAVRPNPYLMLERAVAGSPS
jgi:murein DD-endopeptidase MepM/ murein hydrolase activator NlpD